ncbi:olfactory receptor 1L4-like [Gastrophryne carolinensis]
MGPSVDQSQSFYPTYFSNLNYLRRWPLLRGTPVKWLLNFCRSVNPEQGGPYDYNNDYNNALVYSGWLHEARCALRSLPTCSGTLPFAPHCPIVGPCYTMSINSFNLNITIYNKTNTSMCCHCTTCVEFSMVIGISASIHKKGHFCIGQRFVHTDVSLFSGHSSMEGNMTLGFILLGFSDLPVNRFPLFSVILVGNILTWMGNLLLLMSICLSRQLHTPMYFFLGNLSVMDLSFSTVSVPKLLSGVLHGAESISFLGCFLQMYFFVALGVSEALLLVIMAFDRYSAICNPLHYTSVIDKKVQVLMASSCWASGFLHSLLHLFTISNLKYCEDRLIHHFCCDITSLIKLSCSSTTVAELLLYIQASVTVTIPFILILISYVLISWAVINLKTTANRRKAFSSCSSHLMVVCLFYGPAIFMYSRPPSNYSPQNDRVISMAYIIITPMLNPFIYSLRNQEVKQALKKIVVQVMVVSENPPDDWLLFTVESEVCVKQFKTAGWLVNTCLMDNKGNFSLMP